MSKEMMIVFVYDTEACQTEADDPVEAVLYFHPSWVSDVQKISLVGQLMGTAHFLRDTFAARPSVISLQSGRFVLKDFGRFLLAVGTDRNLPSSTLQHRADLLASLVRFFHRDIQTMHDQFNKTPATATATASNSDPAAASCTQTAETGSAAAAVAASSAAGQPYKSLADKLYHVFETYLPILQHNGNIFQNMPISRLPKSSSNIFLDAMQTLQCCQQTRGVLGGSIFFHNKVLATQLTPELTKNLILTDPYRIKSTAESLAVQFHIPVGVQLMSIYIPAADHRQLRSAAQRAQTIVNQSASTSGAASATNGGTPAAAGIVPFLFKKKMKRDKSTCFSNIPEEEAAPVQEAEEAREDPPAPQAAAEPPQASAPIKPPTSLPIKARPNHLPLRFKNITSKDLPESGFSSISFDETDSFPQFIGKTSVCSTPMTEMKVLATGALMSICAPSEIREEQPVPAKSPGQFAVVHQEKVVERPVAGSNGNGSHAVAKTSDSVPPIRLETRRHSLSNMQESLKKIRLAMRPFGHGLVRLGKTMRERAPSPTASLTDDDCDDDDDDDIDNDRRTYRTITDPMYPVFNSAGAPISRSLFQEFLDANAPSSPPNNGDNRPESASSDQVVPENGGDPLHIAEFNGEICSQSPEPLPARTPSRTALSLPLKSLSLDLVNTTTGPTDSQTTAGTGLNMFEVPAQRKKLAGIQLTPLMTKLSILAMADERSSGFSSWDTTPGCGLDMVSTPAGCEAGRPFRRRSSTTRYEDLQAFEEVEEEEGEGEVESDEAAEGSVKTGAKEAERDAADGMHRCELFVCGQQNMTMLLVLEQAAGQRPELVQTMFETCVSRLARIEANLSQTLSVNVDGDHKSQDPAAANYSFLCTDPHWDTLQRDGPWAAVDLLTLESMRADLRADGGRSDMVVRTDDAVVYGYRHGESAVFYKQTAALKPGLPPPADAMGVVGQNAKRRLERDHSIVLL